MTGLHTLGGTNRPPHLKIRNNRAKNSPTSCYHALFHLRETGQLFGTVILLTYPQEAGNTY